MTISLERSLRHMAWANQKVFNAVAQLPDESLKSYITNSEWTVADILVHICNGTSWYVYCLGLGKNARPEMITKTSEIPALARLLAEQDALLINASSIEDKPVTVSGYGDPFVNLSSTILSQAPFHATEHRAQLIGALEYKGYESIKLDDIDFWAFEAAEKN